jgi:hypothetical protein
MASLDRTIHMDPPRTRMKKILAKQRVSRRVPQSTRSRLWVLLQDVPLHISKYSCDLVITHRYFRRFFVQIKWTGGTCLVLQVIW